MTKPIEAHPAIAHRCPFCGADAGTPCVTRNSGREQTNPHSRRIALTQTEEERQRYAPKQVDALCCDCGQVRTVSNHHSKRNDPNRVYGEAARANGWRATQTLKCEACGAQTRHAVMAPSDAPYRYSDEEQQRIALGDADTSRYGHLTDLERVRREYREKSPFPRNPNLYHRYWTKEAQRAWDDGTKKAFALCGEPITIDQDPSAQRKYAKKERNRDGYYVAEIESDVEITDLETGLSWIAMDCVDCCRVSNASHAAAQRGRLEWLFAKLACHPELVPDHRVTEIMALIEDIYGVSDE